MSDGTFLPKGATPWSSYNTPRIWAMVENEDDPESWRQVAALGSMAGLLKDQRSRLEAAKQKLIEAWPPEQNKASAAFVDLMDDLLFNMAENKKIADANAAALGQVLEALRQAKAKIEPLYQTYREKSDDWVPGWWDHAEDELDEKAREQMRHVERIVAEPDNVIVAPDIYEFGPRTYVDRPIGGPGGLGPGASATPFAASGSGGGRVEVPHSPPPPLPDPGTAGQGGESLPGPADVTPAPAGPSLAGVIAPAPAVSPVASAPLPPVGTGSAIVPTVPGLVIGGTGGAGGRTAFGGGGRVLPGSGFGGSMPGRGGAPAVKPAPPSWLPPAAGQPNARGARGSAGRGARTQNSMIPGTQAPGSRGRNAEHGRGSRIRSRQSLGPPSRASRR
ncbi:hypothetical protein GCM10020358_46670 [Amorphoplanes nipponensis]|uniref:hypothetical protein n=1 Tax=Actinoplanes nipponensis TaxID=135950 RepID=UPI0031E9BD73